MCTFVSQHFGRGLSGDAPGDTSLVMAHPKAVALKVPEDLIPPSLISVLFSV